MANELQEAKIDRLEAGSPFRLLRLGKFLLHKIAAEQWMSWAVSISVGHRYGMTRIFTV
ncbi:MAG: hypothetical protein AAGI03_05405 [Pseudomonadota bacterium]